MSICNCLFKCYGESQPNLAKPSSSQTRLKPRCHVPFLISHIASLTLEPSNQCTLKKVILVFTARCFRCLNGVCMVPDRMQAGSCLVAECR